MKNTRIPSGIVMENLESRTLLAVDLTISASLRGRVFDPGAMAQVTLVLVNHGRDAAGAFDTQLALSESGKFGDADNIPLTTISEPGLAGHLRLVLRRMMLTIPDTTAVGQFHLVGKVDSTKSVVESNEKNNVFSLRSEIQVGAVVSVTVRPGVITPAGPAAEFTVIRSGSSLSSAITVNYAVTGTAVPGTDFSALSGTVIIPAGKRSAVVTLTPIHTGVISVSNKTATLTITPGTDYNVTTTARASASVMITPSTTLSSAGILLIPGTTTSTLLVVPIASPLAASLALTRLGEPITFPVGTPVATVPFMATSLNQIGFINLSNFTALSTPFVMAADTSFSLVTVSSIQPALISPLALTSSVGNLGLTPEIVTSTPTTAIPVTSPLIPADLSSDQMNVPIPLFP